jgi:hypothetical protein
MCMTQLVEERNDMRPSLIPAAHAMRGDPITAMQSE